MAARLRSTLSQIPWFLLGRAALVALLWLFAPYSPLPLLVRGAAFVVAVVFFSVPPTRTLHGAAPFVILLGLMTALDPSLLAAFYIGVGCFLVFLVRSSGPQSRAHSYGALSLTLLFLLYLLFFLSYRSWEQMSALLWSFGLTLLFFVLAKGMVRCEREALSLSRPFSLWRENVLLGTASLIVWEASWVMLFLSLSSFFQAALLFLVAFVVLDFFPPYLTHGRVGRSHLLVTGNAVFIVAVFILASASWEL